MSRSAPSESSLQTDWGRFRDAMPVARKWAYFDHAAVAPLPRTAVEAMERWLQEASLEGDTVWKHWSDGVERVRALAARLLGADSREIALVPNTTSGVGAIAEGFPWQSGDNVVVPSNEFPSNYFPWIHLRDRGVEVRIVPDQDGRLSVDAMLDACDGRTRILSASWVGYASGWRLDLDQLVDRAHRKNVLVFLDAIQGLGVFPLDVGDTPVDFLAADGHKWMLGPEGAGFLYVRQEHQERLRPVLAGWHSVERAHDFSNRDLRWRADAARWEAGSQNMAGFLGLGGALQLLSEFGLTSKASPIAERILAYTDTACERLRQAGATVLSPRDGDHASGIVSFEFPGQAPAHQALHCRERNVALSCRDGRLRISPHAYANDDDLERLLLALRECSADPS